MFSNMLHVAWVLFDPGVFRIWVGSLFTFQSLSCAWCLKQCWLGGRALGPVLRPAPALRREAAVCCVTAPGWLSCPKSFPARHLPLTWTKTDSSFCRKELSGPCRLSSLFPWTTTTFLLSLLELLRCASSVTLFVILHRINSPALYR